MHFIRLCFFLLVLFVKQPLVFGQLTYATLQVQYDSVWQYKNIALIPVRFISKANVLTQAGLLNNSIALVEALQNSKAKIKEVYYENGADVNWLQVINTGKQPLFISSGGLLAGGKQDRMVGETKVIMPGQADYVKVYCIEKGRWADKAKAFTSAGAADVGLKKVMDLTRRQPDVWKEIERQFGVEKQPSATWPYLQLKSKAVLKDSSYLRYFMEQYKNSDSAFAGFLAISGDHIINCELFASPHLTALNFKAMLASLLPLAGLQKEPEPANDKVKHFMDQLLQSEASQKAFVAGRGQMHLYQGQVLHVVAYGD